MVATYTKRLSPKWLYWKQISNRFSHFANMSSLKSAQTKFANSTEKWRQVTKKIFGQTRGFTWRIDPDEGKIYFSHNGIEKVKANVYLIAITATKGTKMKWIWAWSGKQYLRRLSNEHRLDISDVEEYVDCGGEMGNCEDYFKKKSFVLDLKKTQDQNTEFDLRALALEIIEGQYVYEAELGMGANTANAIFVISKAKQIKPQRIPDLEDDLTNMDQNDSDDDNNDKPQPKKSSKSRTSKSRSSQKSNSEQSSDSSEQSSQ